MRFSASSFFSFSSSVFVLVATGCGTSSTPSVSDAGPLPSEAGRDSSVGLGFSPSNIAGVPLDHAHDLVIEGKNCVVDADPESTSGISCVGGAPWTKTAVAQSDGSKIVVYAVHSLWVKEGAELTFAGPSAVAFLVTESAKVDGLVDVGASSTLGNVSSAGGSDGGAGQADGKGDGAGKKADVVSKVGGAGGSYCGKGGGTNAGASYGNVTLIPLRGGSGGGGGYATGGAGGGAFQLVAGQSITVGPLGKIAASGRGGARGAGGGSGGAVLLESPSVSVVGVVAANAGAGGGNGLEGIAGESGKPSSLAAIGGADTNPANAGGVGGASTVDGAAGAYAGPPGGTIPDHGGGAGGGVGRIRINTATGQASLGGTVSPGTDTPCTSQGTLGAL